MPLKGRYNMKDIRKIKLKKGNIIPLKYDFMFIQIFNN